MARATIDADLVLENGSNRYIIASGKRRIELRASARAMMALGRHRRLLRPFLRSHSAAKQSTGVLTQTLQWRWGPLRLTLLRPEGPTRIARLMGLGRA